MASKLQFEIEVSQVSIESAWKALGRDKLEIIKKAAPGLLIDSQILGGDSFDLGSIVYVKFGPVAPHVPPFKEKLIEFDESKHILSFLALDGGYLKLGFTHYVSTIKLDDIGDGKILITSSVAYDLEKDVDSKQLLEEFQQLYSLYIQSVVNYLQKNNA